MRHLVRRFYDCERGAGVIEHALLISVLGLALLGILTLFRSATGDVTRRAAVSMSAQATRGYGAPGTVDEGRVEEIVAQGPAADEPDSTSAEPDSSAASGGFATASSDPAKP